MFGFALLAVFLIVYLIVDTATGDDDHDPEVWP